MATTSAHRTYLLTERIGAECRLTSADVDFLLAEHRTHVELVPTNRRQHYRLTPAGHVGTLLAPSCRLVIRPKIPVRNLFYLLDPNAPLPVVADSTALSRVADPLDFLARRLAQLMSERASAGLQRGYVERMDQSPFLQGRLDVSAHARSGGPLPDRFHCRFEEFTADVPCNQVPKAAAELVLRCPLLGEGVRVALRHSLRAFAPVSSVTLGPDSFATGLPDRLTDEYRPLLNVCRLLVEGLGSGEGTRRVPCPAFLLDMERVFERYVTAGILQARPAGGPLDIAVQTPYRISEPVVGQPDLEIRPDLTLQCAGHPVLIVDAKWKALPRSPLVTTDCYQVLAYCTALGVRHGVLVYPSRRDRLWRYGMARAPVRIDIRALCVTGSRVSCQRSLVRLGRAVLRDGTAAQRRD
jgi:5-methylcytosine-specific restriction enzyme subunit McrC